MVVFIQQLQRILVLEIHAITVGAVQFKPMVDMCVPVKDNILEGIVILSEGTLVDRIRV